MSIINRIAKAHKTEKVTFEQVVESLQGSDSKEIDRQLQQQYKQYTNGTKSAKPKSIKSFITDLIKKHNAQVVPSHGFRNPDQFIQIVNMLQVVEQFGNAKERQLVKPICDRMNQQHKPTAGQMSMLSAIWMTCSKRQDARKATAAKGMLGALAEC